jgi:hypothetical protein
MKKIFVVFFIMLLVTVAYDISSVELWTSDGLYWIFYSHDGQNRGQLRADWMLADPNIGGGFRTSTPGNVHWECLNHILPSLESKNRGDTYLITITRA